MIPQECDECLTEMKERSEQIHKNLVSEIKEDVRLGLASMRDSTAIHLEKQEMKLDAFEKKVFSIVKDFLIFIGTVVAICATIVGVTWLKVQEKADASNVPTMNEIKMLRELGDQYNRNVYERKNTVNADTSAYFWSKENIYGSTMRSEKINYYKDQEPFKSENKTKN